jgi:hypothetical protein
MSDTYVRYALSTKISESLYEVFDLRTYDLSNAVQKDRSDRIQSAILENNIVGMNATDMDNLAIGSIFDGSGFSLPDQISLGWPFDGAMPKENAYGHSRLFALLSNDVVFSIIMFTEDSPSGDKFAAAFSGDLAMSMVGDEEVVEEGYFWNGTHFSQEES